MDTLNPFFDGSEMLGIKLKQMVPRLFASQKKFFYQLKCASGNLIRVIVEALWRTDTEKLSGPRG